MIRRILAFIAICLTIPLTSQAADPSVRINEIAWMGSGAGATKEWLELFNATDHAVVLTGWSIKSPDGKLKITLKGSIAAQGFYFLKRTDNAFLPTLPADLIYKGGLSNDGASLALYDAKGSMIDQADFPNGWPAGNSSNKKTMERVTATTWQTSKDTDGTPKATNSPGIEKPKPLPSTAKPGNSKNVTAAAISGNYSVLTDPKFLLAAIVGLMALAAAVILIIKYQIYVRS